MKIITKRIKSKFRQCLYPYEDYHSKGPFIRNDGRLILSLIIGINRVTTLIYSKYLWEVTHHRKVRAGYQIDHIDGDKTNDVIENLQEITQSENASKGTNRIIKRNIINKKRLFLWCPVCRKRFKISKWKVNLKKLKKGKEFHFCCKECAWKAQNNSVAFPKVQKFKRIKLKEFIPANKHENFKKFSKPIFIKKKIRLCDCGNIIKDPRHIYCCSKCYLKYKERKQYFCPCGKELTNRKSKYCCNECREKFSLAFKVDKEKLLKYCKRSLKKFGRYNYSWIGIKLGVSNNAIKKNIIKYNL